MKIIRILSIIVFAFAPIMLFAKIGVGIEIMPQLSSRFSWAAGVNLDVPISDRLYFSPGVFYSMRHRGDESLMQTYEYHPEGDKPTDYDKTTLNMHADYIHVPLLVGWNASQYDNSVKVACGVYFAYCVGGNSTIKQDFNGEMTQYDNSTSGTLVGNKLDFGLCLEAKYLFRKHYQIGINIQQGLRDIYKSIYMPAKIDTAFSHHLRPGVRMHQSIGLSLGYVF